jgi:hypothetical protein
VMAYTVEWRPEMGGKRPDQRQIDPAEAGATDYKSRRHEGLITEDHKQKVVESDENTEGSIPRSGMNPALAELRESKERMKEEEESGEKGK